MFAAFNAQLLKTEFPFKVSEIAVWGNSQTTNRLLVGSTEGSLMVFDVAPKDPGVPRSLFEFKLNSSTKHFSKKPVLQMNVVDEKNILISLSDGNINVHDLPSMTLRSTLAKSKGCVKYVLDTLVPGDIKLCVGVKRKLILYRLEGKEFIEMKEINISETPRALAWSGDNIFIGCEKNYMLVTIASGVSQDLFPTTAKAEPLLLPLPNENIIVQRDHVSIILGPDGKPGKKSGINWTENPLFLAYSFPYVLGLLPTKGIEVRRVDQTSVAQTLSLRASHLTIKMGAIYVASPDSLWRLTAVPLLEQVDHLKRDGQFTSAIALCDCIADSPAKAERVSELRLLHANNLFTRNLFFESMAEFQDLRADPLLVISLYAEMLPKDMRSKYQHGSGLDPSSPYVEKALQALVKYLTSVRGQYLPVGDSGAAPSHTPSDDYSSSNNVVEIIDTCLLKAYIKTNEGMISTMLREKNYCHVRECESVLKKYQKFSERVLLYYSKGLHHDALQLLREQGLAAGGDEKAGGRGGADDAARRQEKLKWAEQTANYLKLLGRSHMPLIHDFSQWLIADPNLIDLALTVFTSPRSEEEQLPRWDVVLFLTKRPANKALAIPYLEYIIQPPAPTPMPGAGSRVQRAPANVKPETDPRFHNELISQYLDTIKALKTTPVSGDDATSTVQAGWEPGLFGATRKKLLAFLDQSPYYVAEEVISWLLALPHSMFEERAIVLSRIGKHDDALSIYVHRLRRPDLAEEYCKRHYHREREETRDVYLSLLKVYLNPPPEAGVSASGDDHLGSPLASAAPPPMLANSLRLLNKNFRDIDSAKSLELLPLDTRIDQVYTYLEAVMQDISATRRNNQIVRNLLEQENLQVKELQMKARSRCIKVAVDTVCPVCKKRLGTSVFARCTNGTVVHFMCLKSLEQDASTILR